MRDLICDISFCASPVTLLYGFKCNFVIALFLYYFALASYEILPTTLKFM